MPVRKFCFSAHIHYLQFWIERKIHCKFIRIYIHNEINRFSGFFPCFKSSIQITLHLCKSDTSQSHNSFFFFSRSSHEYKWFIERKKASRPFCKSSIEANADRAGHI